MSFNWKALVNLARDLEHQAASVDDPEAHFRSAVSRAYFGAFGHACNYAKEFLDFQSRELVEDHGRLRAHLKRKRRKGDADRLEQLRQWRNEADYVNDLPWPDLPVTVATAINRAETVLASLIPPQGS
jgi:hypothetical protein